MFTSGELSSAFNTVFIGLACVMLAAGAGLGISVYLFVKWLFS